MLKKFFTVMLGSMAAIWLSGIIAMVLFIIMLGGMLGVLAGSSDTLPVVKDKSVLVLDLGGTILEREKAGSIAEEIIGDKSATGTLSEYIAAVRHAASDKRIKGMVILCSGSNLSIASGQELIQAIEDFRDKKFVIAYADNYAQNDYFVACAAQELYLNPQGSVSFHGLGAQIPFFTGLLNKLGVKIQVIKVGKFKSAVEPFILTAASEPSIEQTRRYADGIWKEILGYVSERRGISTDSLISLAEGIVTLKPAETFVADSLVDRLAYRREIDDILKKRCGIKEKDDLNLITPSEYLLAEDLAAANYEEKHIAVYYAVGDIVDSGNDGISAEKVVPDIIALADDDNVKGMILRVNSGGGSAFASEQIWDAVEYFKSKDKPVYVSMGNMAASGGYYISCGADKIFADPATLTGSIGIFGMIPDFSGLVTGKLGVTFSDVETNRNAIMINPVKPLSPEMLQAFQSMVENGYETFTSRVAKGRSMSVDSVKAIAEGRVWYGRDALRIGLVDSLASLETAKKAMAAALHLSDRSFVNYPTVEYPIFMTLLRSLEIEADVAQIVNEIIDSSELASARDLPAVRRLATILTQIYGTPLQARMEDVEFR